MYTVAPPSTMRVAAVLYGADTSSAAEQGGGQASTVAITAIGGGTCRILLTVDDPDDLLERAVAAGATEKSPVGDEHGWRLGRITDPFGHEWEIGRPPDSWPQVSS